MDVPVLLAPIPFEGASMHRPLVKVRAVGGLIRNYAC
jgi:hypothetical protein